MFLCLKILRVLNCKYSELNNCVIEWCYMLHFQSHNTKVRKQWTNAILKQSLYKSKQTNKQTKLMIHERIIIKRKDFTFFLNLNFAKWVVFIILFQSLDCCRKSGSGNAKTDVHSSGQSGNRRSLDAEGRLLSQAQTDQQHFRQTRTCKSNILDLMISS